MRISDCSDHQKAELMSYLDVVRLQIWWADRREQMEILILLFVVALCAFICGLLVASPPAPDFPATFGQYAWIAPFVIGASLALLAWAKFRMHDVMTRARERSYLMEGFAKCAQEKIEFSSTDLVSWLRSLPASVDRNP